MYTRILVPIDDSATAQQGFDEALRLAQQLGSRLQVLHVVDARRLFAESAPGASPEQLLELWRAEGRRLVDRHIDAARSCGIAADGVVRCDPGTRVFEAILQEAADAAVELIVMGTHGRSGLTRVALGSDAECVIRASPVPVLLIRAGAGGARRS